MPCVYAHIEGRCVIADPNKSCVYIIEVALHAICEATSHRVLCDQGVCRSIQSYVMALLIGLVVLLSVRIALAYVLRVCVAVAAIAYVIAMKVIVLRCVVAWRGVKLLRQVCSACGVLSGGYCH